MTGASIEVEVGLSGEFLTRAQNTVSTRAEDLKPRTLSFDTKCIVAAKMVNPENER
jgi:hypothetical protein